MREVYQTDCDVLTMMPLPKSFNKKWAVSTDETIDEFTHFSLSYSQDYLFESDREAGCLNSTDGHVVESLC